MVNGRYWMDPEWLSDQYLVKMRSVQTIADDIGVHPDLVRFYLDQHKIYRPLKKCVHGFVICVECNKKL